MEEQREEASQMKSKNKKKDVFDIVFIGAGIATLYAIYSLQKLFEVESSTLSESKEGSEGSGGSERSSSEKMETKKTKKKINILILDRKENWGGRIFTFYHGSEISSFSTTNITTTTTTTTTSSSFKLEKNKKIPIELGPSRFSSLHTSLHYLLNELKFTPKKSTSSKASYYALRIPYHENLTEERNTESLREMYRQQYAFHSQELEILDALDWDTQKILFNITEFMQQQFSIFPTLLDPKNKLSTLSFREHLRNTLLLFFEEKISKKKKKKEYLILEVDKTKEIELKASTSIITHEEFENPQKENENKNTSSQKNKNSAWETWKKQKLAKILKKQQQQQQRTNQGKEEKKRGEIDGDDDDDVTFIWPQNITTTTTTTTKIIDSNDFSNLAIFLEDSLGFHSEFNTNAIFGVYLILEQVKPATWYYLSEGLGALVFRLRDRIITNTSQQQRQNQIKVFVQTSFLTDIRRIEYISSKDDFNSHSNSSNFLSKRGYWKLSGSRKKPNANSNQKITLKANNIVWTGGSKEFQKVISAIILSPLQKLLLNKINPEILLRIFAQYSPSSSIFATSSATTTSTTSTTSTLKLTPFPAQVSSQYWFSGIPRIITTNKLQMIIPVVAGSQGLLQVSYSDNLATLPWLELLQQDQKEGNATISFPNGFGHASRKSKTAQEITQQLHKLFPEKSSQIETPTALYWHPCVCHYHQPFTSEDQEILPARSTYQNLGLQVNFLFPTLFLAGEANNNYFLTGISTAWLESSLRTIDLIVPKIWQNCIDMDILI